MNVVKILEVIGMLIIIKGIYYFFGKEFGLGQEVKLYIFIEGDIEVVVGNVFLEFIWLLREGMIVVVDVESRVFVSGRYIII